MSNLHRSPVATSKSRETTHRVRHVLVAAASCFIAIPTFGLGLIWALGGSVTAYVVWRTFVISLACAVGTGLCVLPFRSIRWYWAVALGALLAPSCIVTGDYLYRLVFPEIIT